MLELRDEDLVSRLKRKCPRNQIDRIGRTASKNDFVGRSCIQKAAGRFSCFRIELCRPKRLAVRRPMDRPIVMRIETGDRIDHRVGFMRRRCRVEVDEIRMIAQKGKRLSHCSSLCCNASRSEEVETASISSEQKPRKRSFFASAAGMPRVWK